MCVDSLSLLHRHKPWRCPHAGDASARDKWLMFLQYVTLSPGSLGCCQLEELKCVSAGEEAAASAYVVFLAPLKGLDRREQTERTRGGGRNVSV